MHLRLFLLGNLLMRSQFAWFQFVFTSRFGIHVFNVSCIHRNAFAAFLVAEKMLFVGGKNVEKMLHSMNGFVQILSLNVGTQGSNVLGSH
jgi:hypothetical protein